MTTKTRNWLIAICILASPFVFFLGLLIFWNAEPLPPVAPLPNPNGYEDLVNAGRAIKSMAGYDQTNEQQLAELVATNAEALQLLPAGLSNQCRVPVQFSAVHVADHMNDLAGLHRLAQILAAEGRLAEIEGRPKDSAKCYLDAIHLGIECARGGVLIDQLVGTAIEALGVAGLQKLVDQLDAKSCRDTAAALETYDAQGQTWQQVMQQERDWSRRTHPGVGNEFLRVMTRRSLNKVYKTGQEKFEKQQSKARHLTIDLAARAYKLDRGKPPASANDLVPDYLEAIPQDPVTGTNMVYRP